MVWLGVAVTAVILVAWWLALRSSESKRAAGSTLAESIAGRPSVDDLTKVAPANVREMARGLAADAPAIDLSEPTINPTMPFGLIFVSAVGQTDRGLKRKDNEDSYLDLPEHGLFVVADGMGGHAAGEVASALAVKTIEAAFRSERFDGAPTGGRPLKGDELVRAIEMANRAVFDQANAKPDYHGMGTTVVAARFLPNKQQMYIAHAGDSRCYRIRAGAIKPMTSDHTLGNMLGTTGANSGTLIRAVGIADTVEAELTIDAPEPGDYYLLCSDGLSKMLGDDAILDVVQTEVEIRKACNRLIESANERGGVDNVTVILVKVDASKELIELARAATPA